MDWNRDLAYWPNAEASRRLRHGPHHWHIQEFGAASAPQILALHGAGASTHSWRGVIPLLSAYRVIAIDLPGHGFTRLGSRRRSSLGAMRDDIAALISAEGWVPRVILAHSAGAAIALELSRTLPSAPRVITVNAALSRFPGVAGWLFPVIAKTLALNPFVPALFTMGANPEARAERILSSTGSEIDAMTRALYARLISDRDHVDGALQMMAQWDVEPLLGALGDIDARCLLIAGEQDGAVAPEASLRAAEALPNGTAITLDGLGHLAHEEDPGRVMDVMQPFLEEVAS
ncbi:MAG: alpha/beta fold hydrolase BchO [Pseudomonadota bacterium]